MVRVSSSETPGVRDVDTRKIRSGEATTYSSRNCLVSRQKGQGRSLPVSAICRKLLMASPTSATGGTAQGHAVQRIGGTDPPEAAGNPPDARIAAGDFSRRAVYRPR